MMVSVDGAVRYRWYVSTGATGFSTPTGTYKPFRMEVMHYSQEWDNAGMPNSIFFTSRGHAVHGSNHPGLGTPVSHGCVRLTLTLPPRSTSWSARAGMGDTTVIVKGRTRPACSPRASRRSRGHSRSSRSAGCSAASARRVSALGCPRKIRTRAFATANPSPDHACLDLREH